MSLSESATLPLGPEDETSLSTSTLPMSEGERSTQELAPEDTKEQEAKGKEKEGTPEQTEETEQSEQATQPLVLEDTVEELPPLKRKRIEEECPASPKETETAPPSPKRQESEPAVTGSAAAPVLISA